MPFQTFLSKKKKKKRGGVPLGTEFGSGSVDVSTVLKYTVSWATVESSCRCVLLI